MKKGRSIKLNYIAQWYQSLLGITLLLWVAAEYRVFFKKEKRPSKKDIKALSYFALLTMFFVGSSIYLFSKDIGNIKEGNGFIFWSGIILIVFGIAFRQYCSYTMGRLYVASLQIQDKQNLIKTGPFAILRHPCYSGFMLSLWGLGLSFLNWIFLIMIIVFSLIVFLIQIRIEEKELEKFFGNEYVEYKKHTKKLIPYIL